MAKIKWTDDKKQEACNYILLKISTEVKGLRRIFKESDVDLPDVVTFLQWIREDKGLNKQYARAKEEQADILVEECLEISDDGRNDIIMSEDGKPYVDKENVQRSRLRVDTRKWLAGKLRPRVYGDKLDLTSGDEPIKGTTIVVSSEKDKEILEKV